MIQIVRVEIKFFVPGEIEELVDFVSVLQLHRLLEGHFLLVEAVIHWRVSRRRLAAESSEQSHYPDGLSIRFEI